MSESTFVQAGNLIDYTPAAAALSGAVVQIADGRVGVVQSQLAAGQLGSVAITGIFKLTSDTAVVFADGETVYWDPVAKTAVKSTGTVITGYPVGPAVGGKLSGELSVNVAINANGQNRNILSSAVTRTLVKGDVPAGGLTFHADTQAGAFSVVLPPAADWIGRRITFVRTGTGVNAVTIDGNAAETVDGSATFTALDAVRDTATFESNGTAVVLVAARIA
jgi:predicted RecA/RadA family phage recombinase